MSTSKKRNDMKETLFTINNRLQKGEITAQQARVELCILLDVSLDEQSEATVCDAYTPSLLNHGYCTCGKHEYAHTEQTGN
jgi:hypothetical protein